jgi:hypothetical protein
LSTFGNLSTRYAYDSGDLSDALRHQSSYHRGVKRPDHRRVVQARLLRPGQKDNGAFDRAFWARVGPEGRLEAMWQMVKDYRKLKGLPPDESRLRRTVGRLVRRAR